MAVRGGCVTAIGRMAVGILKDDSPFEELLIQVLAVMPAQIEVGENRADHVRLAPREDLEQFAAVSRRP
jgi:hypothetical protein